jgi:hypothetical protein
LVGLLAVLAAASMVMAGAAEAVRVRHEPVQPRSGQPVRIKVAAGLPAGAEPVLEFQVVLPGRYVAKADPGFERGWTRQALKAEADGSFTAELPPSIQTHRNLVRYRIRSGPSGAQLLPPKDDEQGNFAYFVYDGVPAWRGAVNPKGAGAAAEVKTFPPAVLTNVPVYHLIAAQKSVEEAMWKPRWDVPDDDPRHAYRHTGTFVCDGEVYDHVKFRARGGGWRHSMGKNMWKFNFNAGHRLAAKDFYGRPYAGKWDKLNLGACIQQGDYRMRGEQGMFEAVTFRLFNLAGTEAPRTHWVHLRVVAEVAETSADQYRGDFWGLYLAVEEIDGDFLKEHGLPDGNVYKIEGFQPHAQHFAKGDRKDSADATKFLAELVFGRRALAAPGAVGGWAGNVDLDRYYAYRSVVEATHHYDIGSGKNYFFYHNLSADRWQVVPWDVDLSWGEHMYGDGNEPMRPILGKAPFREAYQRRLSELRDLLLNSEALGRVIDEHAAMIWHGPSKLSLADADRAKWDYHPIMSSRYVDPGKSEPGLFYQSEVGNRFGVMPELMKEFARRRQRFLARLLDGHTAPPAPVIAGPTNVAPSAGSLRFSAETPADAPVQWRLAEITDPKRAAVAPREPWRHEIEALWQATGGAELAVPVAGLVSGHTYRVRARAVPKSGPPSRWSEPVEWVAP